MTHIRTTHTGSLPRPPQMLEAVRAHFAGQAMDEALPGGSYLIGLLSSNSDGKTSNSQHEARAERYGGARREAHQ